MANLTRDSLFELDLDTVLDERVKRFFMVGEKAIRWAVADAMTSSGADAANHMKRVAPSYIDRPTPYTLRSIGRWPGFVKPQRMQQWVGFKTPATGQSHYLEPMVFGGGRPQKANERRLAGMGGPPWLMPTGEAPARLNSYGNVSAGTYSKILSQLKAGGADGSTSTATNSQRSKRRRKAQAFFLGGGRRSKNRIVFARRGKNISPVFVFTSRAPRYRRSFPADEILAQRYIQRFKAASTLYLQRKLDKM